MAVETLLQTLEQAAAGEADRILAGARAESDAVIREAEAAAARRRALVRDEARARAREAHDRAFAAAARELKERLLAKRTDAVEQVLTRARRRLATLDGAAYGDRLDVLVRVTVAYLAGAPATVVCRPDVGPGVEAGLAGAAEVTVAVDAEAAAGVLGRSADGRVTVDNTLPALLERLRPELAIAIARRIEEGLDALG